MWTSTNELAITSVVAYFGEQTRASIEEQLTFVKVDTLFFSYSKIQLRLIG